MSLQKTISKPIQLFGVGLHSGQQIELKFYPAPAGVGIKWLSSETNSRSQVEIPLSPFSVQATQMATTIGGGEGSLSAHIATIEHCLSAIVGLEIDNLIIEVSGSEVPILDGSAKDFMEVLLEAGLVFQSLEREYFVIHKKIKVIDGDKWIELSPYPGLHLECHIDFAHPVIGKQFLSYEQSPFNFKNEIAAARTFGFISDIEKLKAMGLIQGGSLENAIVLDNEKILGDVPLRWPDEFVRHKILDTLGDLMTLGRPLLGRLQLHKSGHDLMNQLVKKIYTTPESFSVQTGCF